MYGETQSKLWVPTVASFGNCQLWCFVIVDVKQGSFKLFVSTKEKYFVEQDFGGITGGLIWVFFDN